MNDRRRVKWNLVLAVSLLVLTVFSCSPMRLVADYDPMIDSGTTQVQKKVDSFLIEQKRDAGTPKASYANAVTFYDSINLDVDMLIKRAELQGKNSETITQLNALKNSLKDLQKLHKVHPNGIPVNQIGTLRTAIDVTCQAIIGYEIAKRRGEQPKAATVSK